MALTKKGRWTVAPERRDRTALTGISIRQQPPSNQPVWKGPEVDGITFSLLSKFLTCRERFRLLVVEGLRQHDEFNHRVEYGNGWHLCEQCLAANAPSRPRSDWEHVLVDYYKDLVRRYPTQAPQIDHWFNVCKVQFALYVRYWANHPDVKDRTPICQEQVFDVPYTLPSGRVVKLRGKFDAVDLIGKNRGAGIYLFETKTKSDINEEAIKRNLAFDLQTGIYLTALSSIQEMRKADLAVAVKQMGNHSILNTTWAELTKAPIKGVRYNVIRRPLSGGKGSIVRHKPTKSNPQGEGKEEFYDRLSGIIAEDPGYFFMRWKVEIGLGDVERFRRECLDPILENLCCWWGHINARHRVTDSSCGVPAYALHWRHPYGCDNLIDQGYSTDLDEYLRTGSTIGLERITTLFGELET